jgi:hypothetical protein
MEFIVTKEMVAEVGDAITAGSAEYRSVGKTVMDRVEDWAAENSIDLRGLIEYMYGEFMERQGYQYSPDPLSLAGAAFELGFNTAKQVQANFADEVLRGLDGLQDLQ